MQLNTEFHQQSRCRLAFNKLYVDLVDKPPRRLFSGMDT